MLHNAFTGDLPNHRQDYTVQPTSRGGVPTGALLPFAGIRAPDGYLLCDGTQYPIVQYAALYSVCGTLYNTGGETAGNFRVPDMRGRVPFGNDQHGGFAAGRLTGGGNGITGGTNGNSGGEQNTLLTTAGLPAHHHASGSLANASHTHTDAGHTHPTILYNAAGGSILANGADFAIHIQSSGSGNASLNSQTPVISGNTADSTGGDSSHNNVPPGIVVYYIIKF